ncbi:hypothetical protein CK203_095298 [Vitis vinifera]|uniref:Remorin C-terminal domain-containing protein n=1 Tax=Vitis vinifera TaxID=29760 RepID=A0A438D8E1_VITVI|nr:hypothetical protein CK203_095298 [Vitis vinifera]
MHIPSRTPPPPQKYHKDDFVPKRHVFNISYATFACPHLLCSPATNEEFPSRFLTSISSLCIYSPLKNLGIEPISDCRIRNMESLIKQKSLSNNVVTGMLNSMLNCNQKGSVRVSFSGSGQHSKEASHSIRERPRGDKVQNWFWRQFSPQMSKDYDSDDEEFATAVAAAAFAIYTLEEPNLQYQKRTRDGLETSMSRLKSRKEDTTGFFGKETQTPGEASIRRQMTNNGNSMESAFPSSRPSKASPVRSVSAAPRDQRQQGYSTSNRSVETKADAWEKAQITKIKKRNDNISSRILAWENEKKMRAKLIMERKKSELEQRKALNLQHYQIKIERIDQIAGGARAQLQEKRRNEESEVKHKAEMIRKTGKVPVRCFCF